MNLFYEACRPVVGLLLLGLADCRIEGLERVPRQGPLIVVSNHVHFCDPPLLGGVLPRYVRFMAKREAFKPPWGLLFSTLYGAFPVRRGQLDRQAIRRAEEIVHRGGALAMFPEGHRSHGRGLQPGLDGAALIAVRTGAPVLPIGITGTEAVLASRPRWAITIRVGQPFTLARGERPMADQTSRIMLAIAELLPAELRGPYGARLNQSQALSEAAG
ncbi:MAG: lysophospholipid acyltransferase family protein [Chloroflexota bacterium]